jgi:hypothetical protein
MYKFLNKYLTLERGIISLRSDELRSLKKLKNKFPI